MKKQYDHDKLMQLFGDGYALAVIGERLGVSKETVRRELKRMGIETGSKSRNAVRAKTYGDAAKEMRLTTGKSWRKISEEIGYSERQIRRWVSGKP
jgi:IS30 family transposase